MPNLCTICVNPRRGELEADLASGRSAKSLAPIYTVSLPALYRHIRSGHHQAPALASGTAIAPSHAPSLVPSISATLRDVQRLAREAWRHLKDARAAGDHKATNGAITASAKALELVGRLRGELQTAASSNVTITVEAKSAMDLRAQADALRPDDVTEQAEGWLGAQLEAGDQRAISAVGRLVRMLPSAEVVDT